MQQHQNMANMIRSAKSASDWGDAKLKAYNIKVINCSEEEFFGSRVSELSFDSEFLQFDDIYDMHDKTSCDLAWTMEEALNKDGDAEPSVDWFANKILEFMGYTSYRRQVQLRRNMTFTICREKRWAKADITLVTVPRPRTCGATILLIEEDKKAGKGEPIEQMVPQALAAFQHNNRMRELRGVPPREFQEQVIPAITLVGMTPTFYKVPVTLALMEAMGTGQYPTSISWIQRYKPDVVHGMISLRGRRKILEYYQGFKKFVEELDKQDLED
ncbi:hypothetical protein K439DRAFT_1613870 [Ramaria rubella]|nr:hypothetical protein K439DRAFT_1613870 [Ramaria rubella]